MSTVNDTAIPHLPDVFVDLNQSEEQIERDVYNKVLTRVFPSEQYTLTSIRTLTGGVTNRLFKVDLVEPVSPSSTEDASQLSLLVRVNGNGTEHIIDRSHEQSMLRQVHNNGQGPRVFGTFGNGMIYQYFEGRPLHHTELREHAPRLARKMARFHMMDIVDGTKSESAVMVQLGEWIQTVKQILEEHNGQLGSTSGKSTLTSDASTDNNNSNKLARIMDICEMDKLVNEFRHFQKITRDFDIGFCHNDLLPLNIIYDDNTGEYFFIDFEYCCYNFVAFDIGNHFCEYAGMDVEKDRFPDHEQQIEFISHYLAERMGDASHVTKEDIDWLQHQILVCAMLANFYWGVWSIIQARYSTIAFDYCAYAKMRLGWFWEMEAAAAQKSSNADGSVNSARAPLTISEIGVPFGNRRL